MNNKLLILSDMHFKDNLPYADYISDKRISEKKEILDFIVKSSQDCNGIVMLGDCFDSKNPSAKTTKDFVAFMESFGDKDLYLINGNHSKKGDGSTALDFLYEIKSKPNWHIFTKPNSVVVDGLKLDFLPYMLNSEMGVEDSKMAVNYILDHLEGGDILFTHHNITGTSFCGISTDTLKGVVLPKEELEKKYKKIFGGDIHEPQQYGNVIIAGSIFTGFVGELEKFIWTVDDNMIVEKIKLPYCRPIHKLTNPTPIQLTKLPKNSIVKIVVTDKNISIEELKVVADGFDASLIVEDYPSERKKMKLDENNAMDFSIESLLRLYSDQKGVDYKQLIHGLELIN